MGYKYYDEKQYFIQKNVKPENRFDNPEINRNDLKEGLSC